MRSFLLANRRLVPAFLFAALLLTACTTPVDRTADDSKLKVVATTTLVGDIVRQIGGDAIHLTVLLPVGSDPHSYEPTPQDIARVTDADVIFVNGLGLEAFLENMLESASESGRIVPVSEGIEARLLDEGGSEHQDSEQHPEDGDPHVWMDPNNVIVWVGNIESALKGLDPAHAETYAERAGQYRQELSELNGWIKEQAAGIPPEQRELVTDHLVFGYFADRYGFQQTGTIFPGYSTIAQPSAQDLAALENIIQELDVRAIFVGKTINPALAERISADTGTRLVYLYTGSLTEQGGEADTYLAYMRYNVSAIVEALKK